MIGFKQYFRATPPLAASLARTVRVVLYEGGYAGVQLVSPDVVNLCLVVHRATLEAIGGNWEGVCRRLADEPMLRPVLDAEPLLSKPLAISGVPYGFLAQPDPKDRVYRLGDQAAVIPSFCGDGMAIAIHSGVVAADAVIDGAYAYMYQRRLLASTRRPVQIALQVQRIAQHPVARMAALAGLTMLPGAVRLLARLTRMPNHPRS
jgi:flavin-dependent dehydrogenase